MSCVRSTDGSRVLSVCACVCVWVGECVGEIIRARAVSPFFCFGVRKNIYVCVLDGGGLMYVHKTARGDSLAGVRLVNSVLHTGGVDHVLLEG